MAWSISDLFPPWGDSGERPTDNFQYQGGDQVNEKHLDYNRSSLNTLEDEVRSALQDLDSDQDGIVDEADSANAYKGNDIDTNGDGVVDEAEFAQDANVTVDSYKGNDIDTDGDGIVNEADSANAYKHNDIDSDGDGTVDQADQSNDTLAYKGNDIDSDGDGTVDKADEAVTMEARTSDPASPVDGQMWIRTDL